MHIAVVGCGHGEIDKIYEVVENIEKERSIKVSLVLCCGDFESMRNMTDLRCMACPVKYQQMHDFHRYYSGEKKAPVLTIFIGGNHEASNFLQELPYGGWVAPNFYYMGYVGVVKFGSIRIAGLSGIYKGQDYLKGRYEAPPYDQGTMRSVYHYRNIDIFRLKQLQKPVDIVLSHDWPKGIHQYGNTYQLLRKKPFFRDEIERNELGSRPLYEVMEKVQPRFWFSAHMHVKFAAFVPFPNKSESEAASEASDQVEESNTQVEPQGTKFLALDKVLPRRQFLQIIEIPAESDDQPLNYPKLEYDPEWLAILQLTNHLLSIKEKSTFMPGPGCNSRFNFTPTENETNEILEIFDNDLCIPDNFCQTAPTFKPEDAPKTAFPVINSQTRELCQKLGISDPLQEILDSAINNPLLAQDQRDVGHSLEYSIHSQLDISLNDTSLLEDTTNPDEISLDINDDLEDNKDNLVETTEGVQNMPSRSKLFLPPPKSSETIPLEKTDKEAVGASEEELQLLRSVMGNTDEEVSSPSTSLFFIDTQGDEPISKRRKDLGSFKY